MTCMVSSRPKKGTGKFFKFFYCSNDFITQKVHFSRLMRVCASLIILAACTLSRFSCFWLVSMVSGISSGISHCFPLAGGLCKFYANYCEGWVTPLSLRIYPSSMQWPWGWTRLCFSVIGKNVKRTGWMMNEWEDELPECRGPWGWWAQVWGAPGTHTCSPGRCSRLFADTTHNITVYAPRIYTAPCIMFWMHAYPLRVANPLPLAQVMDMHPS